MAQVFITYVRIFKMFQNFFCDAQRPTQIFISKTAEAYVPMAKTNENLHIAEKMQVRAHCRNAKISTNVFSTFAFRNLFTLVMVAMVTETFTVCVCQLLLWP